MQKTFAIIFAIFATIIFVLCAIEPLFVRTYAAEINEMAKTTVVLHTEQQHIEASKAEDRIYLYLSSSTPLTIEYLAENPDYYVTLSSSRQLSIYAGESRIKDTGYSTTFKLSYSAISELYEADPTNVKWKEPIAVKSQQDGYLTIIDYSASAVYEESFLNVFGNFFSAFWDGVKTAINFVVENPIVMLCVGVAFVGSAIAFSKRVRY